MNKTIAPSAVPVALPGVSLSCSLKHISMGVRVWGFSLFLAQVLIDPHVVCSAPAYADQ